MASPERPSRSGHRRGEARSDALAKLDQRLHRFDRAHEGVALMRIEIELDDALDALGADHYRHTGVEPLHMILAVEIRGAGQDALVVLEIRFRHLQRGGGRRVIGGAGFEQTYDLGAAVARALHDLTEPL